MPVVSRTIETWQNGVLIGTRTEDVEVPVEEVNADALRDKAKNALAQNATFLALASPSNAQIAAQVRLLTRECTAIIRLLVGVLDSQDGT